MQLDGLLGQTWNASAVMLQSDDEVEEYRLQATTCSAASTRTTASAAQRWRREPSAVCVCTG